MATKTKDVFMQDKIFVWMAAGVAAILSLPLIAMQFSNEWTWKPGDFIIMGTLLFGAGSVFVLFARKYRKNRLAIGLAILFAVLWIWVELAVGVFTNLGS